MYVKIKDLPPSLQSALNRVGYARTDIEVKSAETYTANPITSGDGSRGFIAAVNLATGQSEVINGAWGGANMFSATIDHDNTPRALVANMAVIKGESGSKGCFASIVVAFSTLAALLPAPSVALTDAQLIVLHCLKGYKSAYRKDEASRAGINALAYAEALAQLVTLALAKQSSNGAAQITTEGKNALSLETKRVSAIFSNHWNKKFGS